MNSYEGSRTLEGYNGAEISGFNSIIGFLYSDEEGVDPPWKNWQAEVSIWPLSLLCASFWWQARGSICANTREIPGVERKSHHSLKNASKSSEIKCRQHYYALNQHNSYNTMKQHQTHFIRHDNSHNPPVEGGVMPEKLEEDEAWESKNKKKKKKAEKFEKPASHLVLRDCAMLYFWKI